MNPGRRIRLTNTDLEAIREQIPGIQYLSGSTFLNGEFTVNFGQTRGSFTILGSMPDLKVIESITMDAGRYINQLDYTQKRKIAIIGRNVKQVLFGNHRPLGEYIQINGVYFKVAGVFNRIIQGESGSDPTACIYIPVSTLQQTFKLENTIHWVCVGVYEDFQVQEIEEKTVALLKQRAPCITTGSQWNHVV